MNDSEFTIIAVGKDSLELALELKKQPLFRRAGLSVCSTDAKFLRSSSRKGCRTYLLPPLVREPVYDDAMLVEHIVADAVGNIIITALVNTQTAYEYAPLIALCARMKRRAAISAINVRRFGDRGLKAFIRISISSRLTVRQVHSESYIPLAETVERAVRLVLPKLAQSAIPDEAALQQFIAKEHRHNIALFSNSCNKYPITEFNLQYISKNMSVTFIPKNEADDADRLINLYGRKMAELYAELQAVVNNPELHLKPALPLLLYPKNDGAEWNAADLKIMVFGRETNNWNDPGKKYYNFDLKNSDAIHHEVDSIQEIYNAYFNWGDGRKSRFNRRGPERFISQLQKEIPGKKIEYMWNNICKIGIGNPDGNGKCCGLTPEYIYNIEINRFNVVREEIDILKPDVIIFMTGREHGLLADRYIEHHIGTMEFEPIDENLPELHRVEIPGVKYAVRMARHPSRASNIELDTLYAAIINDMRNRNVI